jgi:hypothetical protein
MCWRRCVSRFSILDPVKQDPPGGDRRRAKSLFSPFFNVAASGAKSPRRPFRGTLLRRSSVVNGRRTRVGVRGRGPDNRGWIFIAAEPVGGTVVVRASMFTIYSYASFAAGLKARSVPLPPAAGVAPDRTGRFILV